MTAKEIEIAVARYFGVRSNIIVPNVSWGFLNYECDVLIINKYGYATEVEIKVSVGDLKRDKLKKHSHNDNKIKRLYFAIPEKLLKFIENIPDRAGILLCKTQKDQGEIYYVCEGYRMPEANKNVEPLTTIDQLIVARLGTMRIWGLKQKILDLKRKKQI